LTSKTTKKRQKIDECLSGLILCLEDTKSETLSGTLSEFDSIFKLEN
jgi:hypothetical protein